MPTPQSGFFNDAHIETTRPIDFGMTHAPLVFIVCSWAWNDNISHLNINDWKMKFVAVSFRMFFNVWFYSWHLLFWVWPPSRIPNKGFFGGSSIQKVPKMPCYPQVVTIASRRGEDILTTAAFFFVKTQQNLLPTEAFERHLWCIFQRGSLALGFCAGLMAWLFLTNGAMNPIPDAPCR